MGLTHAALQKNVISGAEPVVSAEGEFLWVAKRFNLIMLFLLQ